jgi:hypothetical protein
MSMPRVILRLDEAIAREDSPLARECLKAERAGVLARLGMMQEARFALAGLRSQAQRHRSPRLQAWVWMVDGLISHFETVAVHSGDKFRRALALATTAQDKPMMALTSAWLACCAFNASDLPALSEHLRLALQLAGPDHHAVHTRLGLVLGDSYRFAGDEPRSRHWYQLARRHAGEEGDTSMMSALLYNTTAMRAARIGLDDAFGRANLDEARQALLEVESTINYDDGAGSAALAATVRLVRAQMMLVLGRLDEALLQFDACRPGALAQGSAHRDARFAAERAWCLARLGQTDRARQDMAQAQAALANTQDADDRAAAHARLAQACQCLAQPAEAAHHQALADQALREHRASQQAMLAMLAATLAAAGQQPAAQGAASQAPAGG